jgi:hypothetical protein
MSSMWPRLDTHKKRVDVSGARLHLSHWGLFTSLSLNGCPFKQQWTVRNLVNILRWFLPRLSNSPALIAEGFLRQPLSCLSLQTVDAPHASCLSIPWSAQWQRSTGSGPMSGCKQPCLIYQLLHFHQFPRVPTPIPLGSCYVLPISPAIDVTPRLIWNLSGDWHESWWLPACQKEYRCSCMYSHFYILHYTRLNGIFSLECHGVVPKTEAVPQSSAPSIRPNTTAFNGLGPICVPG